MVEIKDNNKNTAGIIKIMIADDHPLLRLALREILEKEEDINVIAEASDGEEAVAIASKLAPNIIIMDIDMPKIDGIEATRQIKAKFPNIDILVLTIYDDSEHVLGKK